VACRGSSRPGPGRAALRCSVAVDASYPHPPASRPPARPPHPACPRPPSPCRCPRPPAEVRVRELEDQIEIRARANGEPLPQRTFPASAPSSRKPPAPRAPQTAVDVISIDYVNPGWETVYVHFNADGQGERAHPCRRLHLALAPPNPPLGRARLPGGALAERAGPPCSSGPAVCGGGGGVGGPWKRRAGPRRRHWREASTRATSTRSSITGPGPPSPRTSRRLDRLARRAHVRGNGRRQDHHPGGGHRRVCAEQRRR
jgi:hypothetical protein